MTIDIPDSLAEVLIATGKELATQDNLATAWPIWYVTELKKLPNEWGEHKERKDSDMFDTDDMCDDCQAYYEGNDEIPDKCMSGSYKCDDTFWKYDLEREYASYGSCFFLTQKACQEYIDANAYHFNNPKPYAGSAHRNDEIQPIIQALILIAGEKVPGNHYGRVES